MADYDAIVIGAGHNGLAAAALLQAAGLHTLCLDSKLYAGGMASTVELFDGYHFEIAGSLQFPTSAKVSEELGLDDLPTVDSDVMSVSLRGIGDDPVIYYTDPMKMLTHLNDVHGAEAVNGMAGLMAWSMGPTRALGRFEAGLPPQTIDEMYACTRSEFERSAITDMLFGSVTDVLDRYLPDAEKYGALRGMLAFLAVNTTYRGPATPGSATAPAFGLAVPDENAKLMKKLRGGIGALTAHLVDPNALPADVRERFSRVDHRGSYLQMHFALDGMPTFTAPYDMLNDPEMQSAIGLFSTPEELQKQWEDCRRGIVPTDPAIAMQFPSVHDPELAPDGKQAVSAFSLWFPVEGNDTNYGEMKVEMGRRVIEKITRLAPDFEKLIIRHTTFTPRHMGTMFGAPGGDYCHGLIHPDQMGPNRPGPTGYVDQPVPIDGLYLGSAGCHGGPGITFIPGYNAAKRAMAGQ